MSRLRLSFPILASVLGCSTLDYGGLSGGSAGGGGDSDEPHVTAMRDAAVDSGGAGGRAIDAGGDAADSEGPSVPRADGGFVAAECSAAFAENAPDAGDAGSGVVRSTDRDCDGVPDQCVVAGDCASAALVAQYLFEGSLSDATPYANDAEAVTPLEYEPGAVGTALSVRGSAARIPRAESLEFTGDMTVELWINPRALPVTGARAGLLDDEARHGLFLTPTGELRCVVGSAAVSGGAVAVERWTHVACVRDADQLTLWQDGEVRGHVPSGDPMSAPGTAPLVIAGNAPSGDVFDGAVDDLRIWREARGPLELSRSAQTRE